MVVSGIGMKVVNSPTFQKAELISGRVNLAVTLIEI
jgi:hypothetical protein